MYFMRIIDNYFSSNNYKLLEINNLDIKKIRKSLGYTQSEFANELDVSLRTVQKWESGESIVRKSNAIVISNMYKMHIDSKNSSNDNYEVNKLFLDDTIFEDETKMALFIRFLIRNHDKIKKDDIGALYIKKIEDEYQTEKNKQEAREILAKKEIDSKS